MITNRIKIQKRTGPKGIWYCIVRKKGKRPIVHRIGAPAVITDISLFNWADYRNTATLFGTLNVKRRYYVKMGSLHCENKPADKYKKDGKTFSHWYLNGVNYKKNGPSFTIERNNKIISYAHISDQSYIAASNGPSSKFLDGSVWWVHANMDHRVGLPCYISAEGSIEWSQMGVYHRDDGPSLTRITGEIDYWLNGKHLDHFMKALIACGEENVVKDI